MPCSSTRAFLAVTVAMLVLAVGPLRPAGAATTVRVPDSIDASGRADVTDQLDRFFATVASGSAVEFPDRGRYRVEGVLRLTGLHDVTIDGHGSTLVAQTDGRDVTPPSKRYRAHWPRLRVHISVQDADGLTLRNLKVEGANESGGYHAKLEGQAGIAVYTSANVVVDHVSVSHTYGDGVYVAGESHDVSIHDSTFDVIGRQGVAVVNATAVVVERNRLEKIARSVFDLEPAVPRWSVADVHLRDNEIGDYKNFLLAAGGAGPNVSDVWLENNHVTGGNGVAVFAGMPRWSRTGLHVIGNVSDVDGRQVAGESRRGVMQIVQIDDVEIRGNRQPVADGAVAVTLTDVCHATVRDNDFRGASSEMQQTGTCTPGLGHTSSNTPRGSSASKPANNNAKSALKAPDAKVAKVAKDHDWVVAAVLAGAAAVLILGLIVSDRRAGAQRHSDP